VFLHVVSDLQHNSIWAGDQNLLLLLLRTKATESYRRRLALRITSSGCSSSELTSETANRLGGTPWMGDRPFARPPVSEDSRNTEKGGHPCCE
jgi:hypothetical protein